ncbi:hypothetical protein LSAT2_019730 [Lamellibrachia satsuma]|nr:hypothetical protein LSAT2_019730 [Lamellibrachia satsuma]
MFEGVLTSCRLTEAKLTDLWTLLTMDQHYNRCWPTSQRRVDNLGDNFKSWIGRHNPRDDVELYTQQTITRLPEVTRKGTARLWVSCSQDYPSGGTPTTPKCLTRASGLTDRCCGCRRRTRHANVARNIHRRRRPRRLFFNYPKSSDTSSVAVGERTRTVNVIRDRR